MNLEAMNNRNLYKRIIDSAMTNWSGMDMDFMTGFCLYELYIG